MPQTAAWMPRLLSPQGDRAEVSWAPFQPDAASQAATLGWRHLEAALAATCQAQLPNLARLPIECPGAAAGCSFRFFPKASAKGSSSNCVAHTTQHNTTQHHTTARHTPARPTTAPHTTARHTPQQDATPPDRLILYSYYILNYFLAGGRIGAP